MVLLTIGALWSLLLLPLVLHAQTQQTPATGPQTHALQQQRDSVRRQVLSSVRQAALAGAVSPSPSTSAGGVSWFHQPWPSQPIEPLTPVGPGLEPESAANAPIPVTASFEQPCDPLPPAEIQPLIEQAAGAHKVPATLLNAVMERESAFRPCAVSPKGAQGLMQLMPATARELGVADPFDPRQNVDAGARLLQQLLTRYNGNLQLALSAYNAGAGRVDRAQGVPNIAETREYVLAIMKKLFY